MSHTSQRFCSSPRFAQSVGVFHDKEGQQANADKQNRVVDQRKRRMNVVKVRGGSTCAEDAELDQSQYWSQRESRHNAKERTQNNGDAFAGSGDETLKRLKVRPNLTLQTGGVARRWVRSGVGCQSAQDNGDLIMEDILVGRDRDETLPAAELAASDGPSLCDDESGGTLDGAKRSAP